MIIGGVVTLVLALGVSYILWQTAGPKTLSDNAAIIGALVALGGVFTAQMVGIALDANRAQQEVLQAYLAKMTELLLDKHLLEKSNPYDAARVTARAQTLSVLERMNARRKRTVVLFLREARLINRYEYSPRGLSVTYYAHYVSLVGADLSGVDLENVRLNSASREEPVNLNRANLNGAKLSGADLSGADSRDAVLPGADLPGADLHGATMPDGSVHA